MCRQWECSLGHSRLVGPVYHSPAHGLSLAAVRRLTQYHKQRYVSHIRACAEIYGWRVQACVGQYTAGTPEWFISGPCAGLHTPSVRVAHTWKCPYTWNFRECVREYTTRKQSATEEPSCQQVERR
ncbi:hypothetical protein Bbelb_377480 [Branchiostoma belcheri]|nr:hypothetical protein Bbelb_377480 [Branchiostoma belcheri]